MNVSKLRSRCLICSIFLFLFLVAVDVIAQGSAVTRDPESDQTYAEAITLLYSEKDSEKAEAVRMLKKLSVSGHARSQHLLGLMYQQGIGVQVNSRQASQWFERAAERGFPMAMLALAEQILSEEGEGVDYEKAKRLLEGVLSPEASLATSPEEFGAFRNAKSRANYLLALLYSNAWGVAENHEKAIELFTVASLSGDQDASMYLAIAFAEGKVVEKNVEKAKEYFELLNLQSTDRMNRSIESLYGTSGDAADRANLLEASEFLGQEVSNTIFRIQTDFARTVLDSEGEDFDAEFAASLLKMAADGGFAEAKALLALLYYRGQGVEQDYEKAGALLVDAIDENWVLAEYNLAILIRKKLFAETASLTERRLLTNAARQGLFAAQAALDGDEGLDLMTPEEALELCERKVAEGDPRAVYSMANRMNVGWLVDLEEDFSKIVKMLEESANSGYARAQFMLGAMLVLGNGVEPDFQAGFSRVRNAAFQELPEALFFMGNCYIQGLGVQGDFEAAFRYFTKAAELGYDNAKNSLAVFHNTGIYVPKNEIKAAQLYLEAAGEGDAEAAQNVGICYLEGRGVRKDVEEGIRWLAKSAEMGNLNACYQLEYLYNEGLTLARDEVEISYWVERAAEMGDKRAMKRAALNYYLGKGVPRNRGKAVNWLFSYQSMPGPIDMTIQYCPGEYEDFSTLQAVLPEDFAALIISADLMAEPGWSGTDLKEANRIYGKLAKAGSMGAKLRLAKLNLSDSWISSDTRKAVAWLKELYDSNKQSSYPGKQAYAAESAYLLSQCYGDGVGVKKSPSKRLSWLESSARLDFLEAQHELGSFYASGESGNLNRKLGYDWLLKAAQGGKIESQLFIARSYLESPLSIVSEELVVDWLKQLVDQGSGEARVLLRRFGVQYKEPEERRKSPEGEDGDEEEEEWDPWIPVKAA